MPGSAGANVGGVNTSRNYVQPADRNFDRNNYDLKVNWNFSPQTQVWGKYSRMGASVDSPQAYLGYEPPTISGDTTVNQYTFGTTWTMNATTVFDATLGISKMNHESIAGDAALGNFGLDELGIHGTNGGPNFSSDPRYAGLPTFHTGFTTIGQARIMGARAARRAHLCVRRQRDEAREPA